MPTGYTAAIADDIDFRTFALRCARAFGACIMQRDNDPDELPEFPPPSDFYQQHKNDCERRLAELRTLTPEQVVARRDAQYQESVARYNEYKRQRSELLGKYEAMLAQVNAWQSPSEDHEGLKQFMRGQIEQSIAWDCSNPPDPPRLVEPHVWHSNALAEAERSLQYAADGLRDELKRHEERKRWIEQLYASLLEES